MSSPEVLRGDRADLDLRAARLVENAIEQCAATQPQVVLGVVGGRSVGGIYAHLTEMPLPWAKLHVFLADERLVPVTSDESNFKLVKDDLLSGPLGDGRMPEANAHPFPFQPDQADAGVAAYDSALAAVGGRFDIAILSAGEDGHTASLFPGHTALESGADGFVLVEGSPKPPPRRISASLALLAKTRFGVVVFYGEGKRDALGKFTSANVALAQCPSKVVSKMEQGIALTDLD